MVVCAGCSCLCDDVEVELDGERVVKVKHACRIGASIFLNYNVSRAEPMVNGKPTDIDDAIEKAIELLKGSRKVAIYGLDNTTLEAQGIAIDLAEKIGALIDNGSKFGRLVELILKNEIPTTTLENVKDYAYVIVYWGCDVHNSMPRHMSRYTYYPRGKKRQRGYEEDRFLVVVDVRRSHTAMLAKKNAVFIETNDDQKLVREFISALNGGVASRDVLRIVKEVKKSEFNVVFGGEGLVRGLKNLNDFVEFVKKFGYFIPADYHTNSMGFFKIMFERTGRADSYCFGNDSVVSFEDALMNGDVDTVLIVADDPLNSMSFDVARKLVKVNTIVIDPKQSFTSKIADVVIPSAISGVECGGTMVRSDGVSVELKPMFKSEFDDVKILKRIQRGL